MILFKPLFEAKIIKQLETLLLGVMEQRRIVSIKYKDNTYRDIEIYDYGLTVNGTPAISAFQIAGGSQSNEHSGWKIFFLDEIGDIIIQKQTFTSPRPKWNSTNNSLFSKIIKSVNF